MLLQTFEVALNGVTNIRHCFVARFSLRDAAGQGWAFGDKHPVFIRFNRDAKFHIASLAIAGAVRNARKPVSYHARLAQHQNNRARLRLDRTFLRDSSLSFPYPTTFSYVSISVAVDHRCSFSQFVTS